MIELADRSNQIERHRAIQAAWAVFVSIGTAELLFASFALGASYGPGPLRPLELLAGLVVAFAIGAAISIPVARRRIEVDARFAVRLAEGRRERRIVVFDDYATIGSEILLKAGIIDLEIDERGLLLRYRDPDYEGPVLRELAGDRVTLERLVAALRAPAHSGGSSESSMKE